jgi:hypothetical protein
MWSCVDIRLFCPYFTVRALHFQTCVYTGLSVLPCCVTRLYLYICTNRLIPVSFTHLDFHTYTRSEFPAGTCSQMPITVAARSNATSRHRRTHSPKIRPRMIHRTFVGECTRPHIAITPLACHSSDRRSFDVEQKTDIKRIVARTRPECRTFLARGRAHCLYTSPLEVARRMFGDVWR